MKLRISRKMSTQMNALIHKFGNAHGGDEKSLYEFLTACAIQEFNTGKTNANENHKIISFDYNFYHVRTVPTDSVLSMTFHEKGDPLTSLSNAFDMDKDKLIKNIVTEAIEDLNSSLKTSRLFEYNSGNPTIDSIPAKMAYNYPVFLVPSALEQDKENKVSAKNEIMDAIKNIMNNPEEHLRELSSNAHIGRLVNSKDIDSTIKIYKGKIKSLPNFNEKKVPVFIHTMNESTNETYFVEVLRQRGKHNNYEVEFGLNDGTKINTGASINQLVAIEVLKELMKPENLNKIEHSEMRNAVEQSAIKIDNQSIAIKNLDDIVVKQKQQNIKTLELGVDKDIEVTNAPRKPIKFNGNPTRLM